MLNYKQFICIFSFLTLGCLSIFGQKIKWLLEPNYDCRKIQLPESNDFKDFFWVVYEDGTSEMINEKGESLIERDSYRAGNPFFKYGKIFIIQNKDEEKKRYFNNELKELSKGYDHLFFQNGFRTLLSSIDDQLGMIDYDGNVLIPNEYASLQHLSSTKILGIKLDGSKKEILIPSKINKAFLGQAQIKGNSIFFDFFKNKDNNNVGKTICILSGKDTLLPPNQYFLASPISKPIWDSLYIIQPIDKKIFGLINYNGQIVMEPQATKLKKTHLPHLFNAEIDGEIVIYNIRNKTIMLEDFDIFVAKNAPYIYKKQDGNVGVMDLNGKEIIPMEWDLIKYSKGRFKLRKDGLYSNYSIKKDAFSKDQFSKILDYKNKKVDIVKMGKIYSLYDGEEFQFKTYAPFNQLKSISAKYIEGRYFIYDTLNKSPDATIKNQGINDEKTITRKPAYTYFDSLGKIVYGPGFNKLKFLIDDNFVLHHDSLMTFINLVTNNTYSINRAKYKKHKAAISIGEEKYFFIRDLINKKEKATSFELLEPMKDNKTYLYKLNGLYGLMTIDKKITEPLYDEIYERSDNRYLVKKNGKFGIMKMLDDE